MKQAFRVVLLALFALLTAQASIAQIGISVSFGPPALPVYEQPICPGDGYLWTPGYWGWDADVSDYYWVPGTWVLAPEPGFLWTPGYWGWGNGGYLFHEGFWGTEIGFYGGINYGFGYFGSGFVGGRWDHDHFFYNTAVVRVNEVSIHNVYVDKTVINNTTIINNRVSYNGGQGGIDRRPSPEEDRAAQGRHVPPVAAQTQHVQEARSNPELRASRNQGKPPIAATARPGELKGEGAVPAREAGGEYHAAPNQGHNQGDGARPGANPGGVTGGPGHAKDVQPHQMTPPASSGNTKQDQKYQQQQQKLVDQQNKEHQKLQAQQEKDDQKAQKSQNQQRQQMTEQQHQRQTQQMEDRHSQQTQQMQERQAPRRPH